MKKNTDPLQADTYYHIYNRGINGTRIFTKKENPTYFLEKYIKYITPVADTFAYVLMGNHFHFLIKTKSEEEVRTFYENRTTNVDRVQNPVSTNADRVLNPVCVEDKDATFIISKQFSHFFNSYVQSFNKQEKRTGSLLETPFRRIEVDSEAYAAHMVFYIHNNPVKHGFSTDFKNYAYSSYSIFLHQEPTFIHRKTVIDWFGGLEPFLIYHGQKHNFDKKWYEKNWYEAE
jgi:putative transposase